MYVLGSDGRKRVSQKIQGFLEKKGRNMDKKERRQALLEQIQRWHEQDENQQIIDSIEGMPLDQRDYQLVGLLARAYNNLARPWRDDYRPLLEKAAALLLSVADQGAEDPIWHYRLGYSYYYLDQEERALPYFERAVALDPEDQDALYFIEQCRQIVAQKEEGPQRYSGADYDAVEAHICRYFGKYPEVMHEIVSPDLHIDICIIPPSPQRNYYTLVTLGMGAHRMNVPEELAEYKLERAELMIALPPDWKLGEEDERWYWPVRQLKTAARLPLQNDTWLGWGHSIDNREPYVEGVGLCGVLLVSPQTCRDKDSSVCRLADGDEVNFYQLIPLHREEMEWKQTNGADALLEQLEQVSFIVDPNRPSAVARPWGDDWVMDSAGAHLDALRQKRLPVEPIAAYSHMAIYLRWCIEHELMSEAFLTRLGRMAQAVREGKQDLDLRLALRDGAGLNSCLRLEYFNEEGAAFSRWYYWDGDADRPYYPQDVDGHAWAYFGEEEYGSAKFQDEAYLFVPWNEQYYQSMAARIDRRFDQWRQLDGNERFLEKKLRIPAEQIRPLLTGWKGPRACLATDGIMVEGRLAGFCFRQQPPAEDADWDSGWRFAADREDWTGSPENCGVYDLNEAANYDPAILPLLNAPYGSVFERDEQGALTPAGERPPEQAEEFPFPVTLRLNLRSDAKSAGEAERGLDALLEARGLGRTAGRETVPSSSGETEYCRLHLNLRDGKPESLAELEEAVNRFGAPKGSQLETAEGVWPVGRLEGMAFYLSPELSQCVDPEGLKDLAEQIDALLDGVGRTYGCWQGARQTALYCYGGSYLEMLSALGDFMERNPLLQKCVVDRIA